MARLRKRYTFSVELSVAKGCFSSENDLLQYIIFRLGLRSRDSDNIVLLGVEQKSVNNEQEEWL